ncbi:MAG TPA: hypothetical protein QGG18_02515, partial [Rhodospirillales bacterium]|nr:hypothetical protein [Rhodospirillales bacterium]
GCGRKSGLDQYGTLSKNEKFNITSGDEWQPLPIDRDNEAFSEALDASDVVWSIGTGVNALREGLISVQQVKALLIAPFNRVASMFAEGIIREAAKKATEKLVAFLVSGGS